MVEGIIYRVHSKDVAVIRGNFHLHKVGIKYRAVRQHGRKIDINGAVVVCAPHVPHVVKTAFFKENFCLFDAIFNRQYGVCNVAAAAHVYERSAALTDLQGRSHARKRAVEIVRFDVAAPLTEKVQILYFVAENIRDDGGCLLFRYFVFGKTFYCLIVSAVAERSVVDKLRVFDRWVV